MRQILLFVALTLTACGGGSSKNSSAWCATPGTACQLGSSCTCQAGSTCETCGGCACEDAGWVCGEAPCNPEQMH
jgi:hypothetical protein